MRYLVISLIFVCNIAYAEKLISAFKGLRSASEIVGVERMTDAGRKEYLDFATAFKRFSSRYSWSSGDAKMGLVDSLSGPNPVVHQLEYGSNGEIKRTAFNLPRINNAQTDVSAHSMHYAHSSGPTVSRPFKSTNFKNANVTQSFTVEDVFGKPMRVQRSEEFQGLLKSTGDSIETSAERLNKNPNIIKVIISRDQPFRYLKHDVDLMVAEDEKIIGFYVRGVENRVRIHIADKTGQVTEYDVELVQAADGKVTQKVRNREVLTKAYLDELMYGAEMKVIRGRKSANEIKLTQTK